MEFGLCTRCCFCFPLRPGLLIWGGINLALGIIYFVFALYTFVNNRDPDKTFVIFLGLLFITGIVAILVLYVLGLYKSKELFIKIYFFATLPICVGSLIYAMVKAATNGGLGMSKCSFTVSVLVTYFVILTWFHLQELQRDT